MTHGNQLILRSLRFLIVGTVLAVSVACSARAQHAAIFGRVVDEETDEPIAGVNVFLDQTTRGAATRMDGTYEIENLKPGSYRVIASMVGYQTEAKIIDITPNRDAYETEFSIHKSVLEFGEVEIVGERNRAWEKSFKRFIREYLGPSQNAEATVILNPFVLDFTAGNARLNASASAPLEIENRALGYHLTVVLTYYRATERMVSSGGPVFFRELVPADEKEYQRWKENRARAYRGSFMHLMRSLVQGRTRHEGFFVAHEIPPSAYNAQRRRLELGLVPFMFPGDQPYLYRLEFENELYVEYRRERSWFWLNDNEAILHEDGYLVTSEFDDPPMSVRGNMASRRIADLLPRDYRVE